MGSSFSRRSLSAWADALLFRWAVRSFWHSRTDSLIRAPDDFMSSSNFSRYIAPNFLQYLSEDTNLTAQDDERKSVMKTQKTLAKLTLLLAVLLTIGVASAQADILPSVRISFAPVGLTMDQTARLNLLNIGVPNGMLVSWRFIDASGVTLAQSTILLPMGKIVSVDYRQHGVPLPPQTDLPAQSRAEVRAQVDIVSAEIPSESLRRSLEIFGNDTGATTICMSGADL